MRQRISYVIDGSTETFEPNSISVNQLATVEPINRSLICGHLNRCFLWSLAVVRIIPVKAINLEYHEAFARQCPSGGRRIRYAFHREGVGVKAVCLNYQWVSLPRRVVRGPEQ